MKKYLILLGIIIVFCQFVLSESPPAIPMNVWGEATVDGSPVGDGLIVNAMIDGVDYAQASVTQGGGYDVILINGDRPLTYNDDPTCAAHWAADEACVQCTVGYGPDHPGYENEYCIEGPEDGEIVSIKIDGNEVMPLCLSWAKGNFVEIETISPIGDWSKNGCVNLATDFPYFGAHYDFTCSDSGWELIYDLNCDCVINLAGDFPIFGIHYEEGCGG